MVIHQQCHLIAVMGGKGGVGKSVFAANFAASLMLELKSPVLLIDADSRSCGDQNVILGLRPNKTVSEVALFQGALNPQSLPQIVTQHASGLAYIGAVRGPEETLSVNAELFLKQLEFLSRNYKYIVVDLGNDLGDFQKTILNQATALMVVTVPEVLVLNQTQRLIGDLLTATYPMEMFQLIVNKATPGSVSPQAISQSLRLPILGMIPQDDVSTAAALQRGYPFVLGGNKNPITSAYTEVVRKITGGTLQKLKTLSRPQTHASSPTANQGSGSQAPSGEAQDARTSLKIKIHNELIKSMDLKKGVTETNNDPAKEAALKQKTLQVITQIVDRESPGTARDERSKIIKEVLEEALGLGPLEDLLADAAVTEIMVNGYKKIFIEKSGRIQLSPVTFTSNMHLRNVIERIVTPLGRRIDEKTPYVDARLKDGSRVNAVIEPLSIDGPAVTIRKFRKGGISPEKYTEFGSITKPMIDFLRICVENGLNVVVSGGTGSGKTSLLNMLSSFIPSHERVVTVEDAAELQLNQEHVVRLETRPSNMEGTGAVTIRDLVRNALRMRPDRIIVGETRDGAALDMLQAMNTGHDGSMTTTHANSPRECIGRLETLCMMAGMELPARAIREQISSAVNLIIQIQRLSDGSRKVTSITEVCGMQGDTVTLQEIFRFKETGFDKNRKIIGTFQAMGMIPTFIEELDAKGVVIPRELFSNDPQVTKTSSAANSSKPGMMPNMMPPGMNIKKTGSGS
ncbi:MAG: Flp pilus assembly complex ATPase component TadA [Proteobacteria bacterium]|jgi:septum site-determining protein MinD|nr:Flp pilus assembly complex ATPase component TadA [Pseudomonadota bacterium]